MSDTHASHIYTEQLRTINEGDALWFPEPHVTGEVQIGDVGCIVEGAFLRFFNVLSPDEYDVPDGELPDGFERLQGLRARDIDTRPRALVSGHHVSKSVTCTKIGGNIDGSGTLGVSAAAAWEYACNKEKGAVLILKSDATKKIARTPVSFEKYAVKHYESWVKYAKEMVKHEKPVLVYGWVKTTPSWTATAFSSSGSKFTTSIGASVPGIGGGNVAITHQSFVEGPVMNRSGLNAHDEPPPASPCDQCIFIRSFHVRRRKRLFGLKLFASAGPHELPDQRDANSGQEGPAVSTEDDQDDVSMSDHTSQGTPDGPMDAVLDYILELSDAEVAVCCQEDLEFRLLGFDWPDDVPSWLRGNMPRIEVDDDGVGKLSLIQAIGIRRRRIITSGESLSADAEEQQPPPPPGNSSRGLSHRTPLGEGEVILRNRSTEVLEWPHLMINDSETEDGSSVVMALSPDGKHIATSCDDTVVTLWNLTKSRVVSRLEEHTDTVCALAFSPDSSKLVSGAMDATAIIWDLATASKLFALQGHDSDIWSVIYSPDGIMIATGSMDCSIIIWNAQTGERLHTLDDHQAHIMQVAFSPDSKFLASCADTVGMVWDMQTGGKLHELQGHDGTIWTMSFSHAGDRIITGSEDYSARVWSVETGQELLTIQEHTQPVRTVAFSPDDKEVVTGSSDCVVVTCNSWTGDQHHVLIPQRNPSPIDTVAYSGSGDFLACGSDDGHVRLWDVNAGELLAEFRGHKEKVKGVVFNADSSDVYSSSEDGTVRGWNVHDIVRLF